MRALIIGGESMLGSALACRLAANSWVVVATTRKHGTSSRLSRYLNLIEAMPEWVRREHFDSVFLCAGITTFEGVRSDPEQALTVNVIAQHQLAEQFIARGAKVIFPSSTAVFSGETPFPTENEQVSPTTIYGTQKALAELKLLSLNAEAKEGAGVCIVRMTKVMTHSREPIRSWISALISGVTVEAFTDIHVAPISLGYAVKGLLRAVETNATGILHLSCREQISYFDFAERLAKRLVRNQDPHGWVRSSASPAGAYRPACAGLGTAVTAQVLGLAAPSVEETIDDLISEWRASRGE